MTKVVHPTSFEFCAQKISEFTKATIGLKELPTFSSASWEMINKIFVSYLYLSGNLFRGSNFNSKPIFTGSLFYLISDASASKVRNVINKQIAAPISNIAPLPNLNVIPDQSFEEEIDINQYYTHTNGNLELAIEQSNGIAAPGWVSLNIDQLSLTNIINFIYPVYTLLVDGSYAYAYNGYELDVIDISDLNNPITLNTQNFNFNCVELLKKDDYLYCVESQRLSFFDVKNKSNISLAGTTSPTIYYNYKSILSGNYIYIIQYGNGFKYLNFTNFNITNPLHPAIGPPFQVCPAGIGIFTVYKDYAIVACKYPVTLQNKVINIANPNIPFIVTSFNLTASYTGASIANEKYYFVSVDQTSLAIYDIRQISQPVFIKKIVIEDGILQFYINEEYLYCIGFTSVIVIDIRDMSNIKVDNIFYGPYQVYGFDNWFLDASFLNNTIYGSTSVEPGLTIIDASKRTLSGMPTTSDRGLWHFDMIATDESGNSAVDSFAMHVGQINVLPISNQQVSVGNSTLFSIAPNTFDYPGATLTYTAQLIGDIPLPAFISFDSSTQTFLFTPEPGDQNSYRIVVTANDGFGGTANTSFDLIVPNRLPFVEQPLSDQIAYSGAPFEYIFSNQTFADLDNDLLRYSAQLQGNSTLPDWLSFDANQRRFFGTPFGKGVYPIEVTANDGKNGTAACEFTITVPNSAPVVFNPPPSLLAAVGVPFSYTFNTNTFYDIDNEPLTYSINQQPSFLVFNPDTRTLSGTPQSQDVGTYSMVLQAQDTMGLSVSTTVNLNFLIASSNNPPVLIKQIPDATMKGGIPFSYTFDADTFVDPQGDTITYEASLEGGAALPAGLYFDSDSRTLSGILQGPQELRIIIRAIDSMGAYATDTFSLYMTGGQNIGYDHLYRADFRSLTAAKLPSVTESLPCIGIGLGSSL